MTTIATCWGEMSYHDSGKSGHPLLFLHGTGCDTSDWAPVIKRKAKETRNRFKSEIWHDFWESVENFDAYAYLERACIRICEVFGGMGRNDLTKQKLRIPSNPNIQWVWIPNTGHYLPHECPVEVAKVVNTRRAS